MADAIIYVWISAAADSGERADSVAAHRCGCGGLDLWRRAVAGASAVTLLWIPVELGVRLMPGQGFAVYSYLTWAPFYCRFTGSER